MKKALLLTLGILVGGLLAASVHADELDDWSAAVRTSAVRHQYHWYASHPTWTGPTVLATHAELSHRPVFFSQRDLGVGLHDVCDTEEECEAYLEGECNEMGTCYSSEGCVGTAWPNAETHLVAFEEGQRCSGICTVEGGTGWIGYDCYDGAPPVCPEPPEPEECPTDPEECPV